MEQPSKYSIYIEQRSKVQLEKQLWLQALVMCSSNPAFYCPLPICGLFS